MTRQWLGSVVVGCVLSPSLLRAEPGPASSDALATDAPLPARRRLLATDTAPWFGVRFEGFYISRLGVPYSMGPEVGAYLFRRLRVTGRLLVPLAQRDQCEDFDVIDAEPSGPWWCIPSGKAKLAYGGSVGYAVLQNEHFVFAPGLSVLATDLAEPGVLLAISAPVDWVTRDGLRVSFELAGGLAVAQDTHVVCGGGYGTCMAGDVKESHYPTRTGGFASLTVAWGLRNDPRPR